MWMPSPSTPTPEITSCTSAGSTPTKERPRPSRSPDRTGRRLDIAGIVQDEDYFRDRVAPHLDDERVRYLGPVDATHRSAFLGGAHALLHLIGFDEPFGFSVAEALACGTPVVAYDRGSMRELIRHGLDGMLVGDIDTTTRAVGSVAALDRAAIRASARERFDSARMVAQYARLYEQILQDRP
jgi:glycosyltransferase involved in cell wall biosynthesis